MKESLIWELSRKSFAEAMVSVLGLEDELAVKGWL